LVVLVVYLVLDNWRSLEEGDEITQGMGGGDGGGSNTSKVGCCLNCSIKASGGRRRLFTNELTDIHRNIVRYYPYAELSPNVLKFVLPHAHRAEALTYTCVWGIVALVLHDDFEIDRLLLGVIFSGAAFLRILATAAMFSDPMHILLQRLFPNTQLLNVTLAGMTLSVALMAMPYFLVFLIGFGCYSFFGGILYILLTEMQASCGTSTWEPVTTQVARRVLTGACLFALPNLYGLHPRLPFVLSFWVAFVSSTVVAVRIYRFLGGGRGLCGTKSRGVGGKVSKRSKEARKARIFMVRGGGGNKPEQNLAYAEMVMLGWLIKGKDL